MCWHHRGCSCQGTSRRVSTPFVVITHSSLSYPANIAAPELFLSVYLMTEIGQRPVTEAQHTWLRFRRSSCHLCRPNPVQRHCTKNTGRLAHSSQKIAVPALSDFALSRFFHGPSSNAASDGKNCSQSVSKLHVFEFESCQDNDASFRLRLDSSKCCLREGQRAIYTSGWVIMQHDTYTTQRHAWLFYVSISKG